MVSCAVYHCRSNNNNKGKSVPGSSRRSKIHYFRFPKNEAMMRQWMQLCQRSEINVANARICSEHFERSCLERKQFNKRLKPNAIPTLNLPDPTEGLPKGRKKKLLLKRLEQIAIDRNKPKWTVNVPFSEQIHNKNTEAHQQDATVEELTGLQLRIVRLKYDSLALKDKKRVMDETKMQWKNGFMEQLMGFMADFSNL